MAILVITGQPARVRRLAAGLPEELVFESAAAPNLVSGGRPWGLVLVDDEIGPTWSDTVANVARSGHRVMLLSREPTLVQTMRAIRAGAHDVVALPRDYERVARAARAVRPYKRAWESAVSRTAMHEWVGSSPAMLDAFRLAARAAAGNMHVLILGESGVGKELLARMIHQQSARSNGAFVAVNCAAHDESQLAAELFGTEVPLQPHGAPFGGQLARAAQGTLFLDDLGDLGPALQKRVATALQERGYTPIGAFQRRPMDARIIAAANRDLRAAAAAGDFRNDLLYEFGAEITVPPLRRRTEDIPVLASYFLDQAARLQRKDVQGFEPEAYDVLARHDWPGNVRELRSIIERALMTTSGRVISAADVSALLDTAQPAIAEQDMGSVALEAIEKRHIRQVWRTTGGHLSETAELLGIHRNTLRRKLEQYGITEEDARI